MPADHARRRRNHLELVKPSAEPRPKGTQPALDDVQLLEAVRAGDESAASELYTRLHPRVAGTVRRLLGASDHEHDDCVQIAFVEIIRTIDRFRGECSLDHWASRVTAHVVYKRIRHRKVERKVFESRARTSDRPEPMSTARRLVARDLASRVYETLQKLNPDRVAAFLLHDVLGFDLRDIAQITSVSVAAAQQRLSRGRREVHTHLANDAELSSVLSELVDEEEP